MNAEIITIGTELLLGEIVDTNSAYIARTLRAVGLDLLRMATVGDNEARIADTIANAAKRSAVIITTGGLGPTVDDPTREAVARAFGLELEYRADLWEQIETRFARWGRQPSENNRRQARIPAGAHILQNPIGTAPGFVVEHSGGVVASLPGVPKEMERMLAEEVLPYLRQKFGLTGVIKAKVLRTVGIGESTVDARIADLEVLSNPTVGLAAHAGQTDIRITAKASSEAEADAMIAPIEAELRKRVGEFIYGEGATTVESAIFALLAECGETLAVAETGTGGLLAARLMALPDSAKVFRGMLPLDGDVEAEAARTLDACGTDWCITIVAQKDSVEIAVACREGVYRHKTGYAGPPADMPQWVTTVALSQLRRRLVRDS